MGKEMDDPRINNFVGNTGAAIVALINSIPDPAEKCSVAMAMAFNSATSLAAMIMEKFDASQGRLPTADHNLLALFLIYEACSMTSDGTARIEFSPMRVKDALTSFEKFTGQKGDHLVNKHLMMAVDNMSIVNKNGFGPDNAKFFPQ